MAKQSSNEVLIKVDKLLALYVRRQEKSGIPVFSELPVSSKSFTLQSDSWTETIEGDRPEAPDKADNVAADL